MNFEDFDTLSNIEGGIKGFSKLLEWDKFEENVKIELDKYNNTLKGVYLSVTQNDLSFLEINTKIENCLETLDNNIEIIFVTDDNQEIEKDKVFVKLLIFGM
ncbi:hypothetical protein NG783_10570 [Aliarcobacter cryaerophilus]|uniref:hypothetical protein n=1 Tax=Aliarcobacter cryaerophilus TaxID=28198 RepID=UPI003DA58295